MARARGWWHRSDRQRVLYYWQDRFQRTLLYAHLACGHDVRRVIGFNIAKAALKDRIYCPLCREIRVRRGRL